MTEPRTDPGELRKERLFFGSLAASFLILQLLPFGAPTANPPVALEPEWNAPGTRELFFRACADCHSNESVWPWYSHVAPASWLIAHDVAEGREHLNVSEWHLPQEHADEAAREVRRGKMPLPIYLPLHPEARLSPAEKQELIEGLVATFGDKKPSERRQRE